MDMTAERALRAVPTHPSDADLVGAARAGELWAQEALYRHNVGAVFGLVRRLLGSEEDVDDVVQDTFILAFRALGSLREPGALRSWMLRIAVGRVSRVIRRRRVLAGLGLRAREAPPDVDAMLGPSATPDVALELARVYDFVVRLDADLRIAFVLRRIEGSTLEEIVELTGASLATVKRRVARAEAALEAWEGKR